LALKNALAEHDGVQTVSRHLNQCIQIAKSQMATDTATIRENWRHIRGHAYSLSAAINQVLEQWRKKNCDVIRNSFVSDPIVIERRFSCPPHALTAMRGIGEGAAPYLHANHIPIDCSIAFIAAQRPLSNPAPGVDNSNAFWRTLMQENVGVVVDLTEANETPHEQHYGPSEDKDKDIGTHTLHLTSSAVINQQLHAEHIDMRGASNQPARTLTRLHFTGWKDNTAPTPDTLIALAEEVLAASRQRPGRVLIHCSHGAGRTGALITFIAASEQIAKVLEKKAGMQIADLTQRVMDLVVSGRIERGRDFVSAMQFPLIIEALLKKHFDGVTDSFLTARKRGE
jgi:protein tyrosine phosphatase